jgi:hypothetical protein
MPSPGPSPPGDVSRVEDVRRRHSRDLLASEGIEGVAVGRTEIGEDAIVVYVRDPSVSPRVPTKLEDVPVLTVVTGPIEARLPGSH